MIRRIFLSSLIAMALAGCTENRASFYVQDMKLPTDECEIPADKNATYYSWGTWDIGLTGAYDVHPLVINNMTSSMRLNPLSAESNLIQVDGAWVTVMDINDNELTGETFVPSPCTVEPEGSSTAMSFQAINYTSYDSLAGFGLIPNRSSLCSLVACGQLPSTATLVLRISVVGVTAGGQDMETPYFYFPISVCCGCLVYFPNDVWDVTLNDYNCHSAESATTETPCGWDFQDGSVDCRLCAGHNPVLCDPATLLGTFSNPWLYCL
jgi:hypothetical protein